jgi:carbon monoxide dehydrogenase subunit G
MGLRFEHSFVVKSAPDRVWAYLTDPYRVAPALPGASITGKVDEETYGGGITVKVGPVSARYRGTVRFEMLDPVARTAAIVATGQDTSGRGGADLRMQSRLTETTSGETEVSMVSEVNVTGIMAQFGRGLIEDVSNQMLQKFTGAMRAELEQGAVEMAPAASPAADRPAAVDSLGAGGLTIGAVEPRPAGSSANGATAGGPATRAPTPAIAAPPIEIISFGGRLLARAAGRTMQKPLFWFVAAVVAGVVIYGWFR